MSEDAIPSGFMPADFTPGFLDHGGPYYLGPQAEGGAADGPQKNPPASHQLPGRSPWRGDFDLTPMWRCPMRSMMPSAPVSRRQRWTLTVNYLLGAELGDWLEARVRIDRLGGRTAYTSGGIWRMR